MTTRRTLTGALALMMLAAVPASADIMVYMEPADAIVNVGETTTIDIKANFSDSITGWGLDLAISEPVYTSWIDTILGASWDAPGGSLDGDWLVGLRFPSGLSGDGIVLATLTFEGLAEGVTSLTLSSGPEEDEGFGLEFGGFDTNVTFTPATLTVVPEPAALVLLTLGAVTVIRRRR